MTIDINEVIKLKNEISTLIRNIWKQKIESLSDNAADKALKKQLIEFGVKISGKIGKIQDLMKEENIDTTELSLTLEEIQEMLDQGILNDLNIILEKFKQLKSMLSLLNQPISMTP